MKQCILTADLSSRIVNSIRAGSFGHVAAGAWGVPRKLYRRWLRLGRAKDAPEPYASFASEVAAAQAQARLRAETNAYQKDARAWLEHGPGREKPGDPGWTGLAKPDNVETPREINFFELPEFMDLCRRLLDALAPFPEARARAAAALQNMESPTWSASDNGLETTAAAEPGRAADAASAAETTTT